MNKAIKNISLVTAGLAVGTTVGFVIANKRAEKILIEHLTKMDAAYQDSLDRITKSGPYSSVDGAAAVLIPGESSELEEDTTYVEIPADDDEEVEGHSEEEVHVAKHLSQPYAGADVTQDETEPEYIPEPETDDDPVDVHMAKVEKFVEERTGDDDEDPDAIAKLAEFVERYKDRPVEGFGGVSFPGQVHDDEEEETPVSSVPGFVTVRNPDGPYIISIDEFMDDEDPYTKTELTYFDGDDTLTDTNDQIVPDIDRTIGRNNLHSWGTGTTDPEQVYIRNERLEMDFEVTKDDGTYTRKILGIMTDDEIARSMTKVQKMRDGDGD